MEEQKPIQKYSDPNDAPSSENKSQENKTQENRKKYKNRKWKRKPKYTSSVSPPRVIFVPKVKDDETTTKKKRSILVHSDTEKDKNLKVTFQDKDQDHQQEIADEEEKKDRQSEGEEKGARKRKVSFKDEEGEPLEEVHIIPPRQVKPPTANGNYNQFHKPRQQQQQPQVIYVVKEK